MAFWNKFKLKNVSQVLQEKPKEKDDAKKTPETSDAVSVVKDEDVKKVQKKPQGPRQYKDTGNAYKVLRKPLVSEKASHMGVIGKYAFVVSSYTNKIEVKKAVEKAFGVHVERVNIMVMPSKTVRFGKRSGTRSPWKKALVTLRQGEKIDLYEGV